MYDNPLSGRIANSIVQLMVISGNYRWLLGLRPKPHQGGCSSPQDPRLLPGSMLRIDMAWPPGKYRFQRPLLRSSSGSKGCCGTGFRTLDSGPPDNSVGPLSGEDLQVRWSRSRLTALFVFPHHCRRKFYGHLRALSSPRFPLVPHPTTLAHWTCIDDSHTSRNYARPYWLI